MRKKQKENKQLRSHSSSEHLCIFEDTFSTDIYRTIRFDSSLLHTLYYIHKSNGYCANTIGLIATIVLLDIVKTGREKNVRWSEEKQYVRITFRHTKIRLLVSSRQYRRFIAHSVDFKALYVI